MKRYSEMSKDELLTEMQRLREDGMKQHQSGLLTESELHVLEQKFYLAKSYLMDPKEIEPGRSYKVEGYDESFQVEYLNGVMAWGKFSSSEETIAIPIGRLGGILPS
jgi:hypothetical protein